MVNKKDVYVVMPGYNEEKRIAETIKGVLKEGYKNLVVVDDGSSDKTYERARRGKCTVLRHTVNLGKGSALKTGADYAVSKGAKYLVFIDSDGQHKPGDVKKLVKKLGEGSEIVFGYRKRTAKMPFLLRAGNWGLSKTAEFLFGLSLRDTQSGFRAMTSKAYKKIRWKSTDYSVETEMIANAGKNNLKHSEVEIETIYHDKYKGTSVVDGVKIGLNMLIWKIFK